MNYKKLIEWVNAIILLLAVVLSVYLIVEYFFLGGELTSGVLKIGYLGILIFSFILEISIQFFGPDIFLVSGILAGFNFYLVLLFVLSGSITGGLLAYYIGLVYGRRALNLFLKEESFENACKFFEKYGKIGMSIAALTPLPYFPVIAGMFKMKFRDFLLYGVLVRTLRFIALALILKGVIAL